MKSIRQGSIHLFRFAGVDVFLHWAWFLLAVYEINARAGAYSSIAWNVLEFLTLFLIVTLHEFGHALACRQVGGRANQIVLWPLGGVAYVDPPPRPGATLWSIAAGPLVNVGLFPVFATLVLLGQALGWATVMPDFYKFLVAILWIDVVLLVFNMLPVYPLDGGQILRSLLWFVLGRARSLMAATIIGFVGVVGFIGLALWMRDVWLGVISVFILMNCWGGLQQARVLSRLAKLPRRDGFACPLCKSSPPVGDFWGCAQCGKPFDTFQARGVCPYCAAQFNVTQCLDCGRAHPLEDWMVSDLVAPKL
jgi:Zn-dependent protease